MRKYVMGLVAVALAVVFSAFSTGKMDMQNDAQTTFKWYAVSYASPYQATGAILQSTDLPFGTTERTYDYALGADGCTNSGSLHCVRGFTTGSEPTTFPSVMTGQSQTPKP